MKKSPTPSPKKDKKTMVDKPIDQSDPRPKAIIVLGMHRSGA